VAEVCVEVRGSKAVAPVLFRDSSFPPPVERLGEFTSTPVVLEG